MRFREAHVGRVFQIDEESDPANAALREQADDRVGRAVPCRSQAPRKLQVLRGVSGTSAR